MQEGEYTFHWLEKVTGGFEAGVGAVVGFGGEAHGCTVGASSAGCFVVARACKYPEDTSIKIKSLRSAAMPC